jgi:tRNA dimethylallyltransferase
VVGPTASGKTALAIALAERLGGELISADSRQVFNGCDIGTNKPSLRDLRGIPLHLVDVVEPGQRFTVADYRRLAGAAIAAVIERSRLPILQGGTGLYVRALLEGWNLAEVPANWALRARLEARLLNEGREALERELRAVDPVAAQRAQRNPRRIIRALEIHASTGQPPSVSRRAVAPAFFAVVLGLRVELSELDRRIEARVDRMLRDGLLDEVRGLRARYPGVDLSGLGHGYREMGFVLDGTTSLEEARASTTRQVRRYARRQLTWFLADPRVRWIEADPDRAQATVRAALHAAPLGGDGAQG